MKKLGIFLVTISFLFSGQIKAQSFDIGMLDNALGLLDKGNQKESSQILGTAMGLLTKSAEGSTGDFASKILGQAGSLSKLLPALESGTANIGSVQKIIQTVKMLYGAWQLNNMVKGGNLLGNSASLLSNVDLLKSGMGLLDGGSAVDKITKSLDKVVKKAPKLEKTGFWANMAQKGVSKKLESSLGLLSGLI